MSSSVPENLYKAELVSYPGPYAFQIPRKHIILVSDQDLEDLSDPDKVIDLSMTHDKYESSLRQICEQGQAIGARTLILAYDHFFSQYRPGQHTPRKYTPDTDEYIERIAAISDFTSKYGIGLELSLLNPLEIGPGFQKKTGQSGVWMHYRKGLIDPEKGIYSVQLWRQNKWAANKGVIHPEDAGVRVFAFKEEPVEGTRYRVVDPENILEITDSAEVEVWPGSKTGNAVRIRVSGKWQEDLEGRNRVLVVQQYKTPEMDYFSDEAPKFLHEMIDRYVDAGVKLNALYSDEMHIQQDWHYFGHHDHGQFALRYVSPGLEEKFAEAYGEEYRDFARYLIYFTYGQEDFASNLSATEGVMHVMGPEPEDIHRTALLRSRYYKFLQNGVTDLMTDAKHYAERRFGHKLEARAHATWAESPTIDYWRTYRRHSPALRYEYTSNFQWSNTVHQAAAACYDYFKWNDYLTGGGNDHPEGGWLDRNYFGLALACSTGILNEVPYAYCAHWGMPREVSHRRTEMVNAYGAAGSPLFGMVQDMQHRDTEVLMLYPLDLVAAEECFGSWMTQYGYANYVTQAKLLQRGKVVDGGIEMAGRRFTTLVALFEPFPSKQLLEMMQQLADQGGRVIWSAAPPMIDAGGEPVSEIWGAMFGVKTSPLGIAAPGQIVTFSGPLADVPEQTILTDFLVDYIYPVELIGDASAVAQSKDMLIGAHRRTEAGGSLTFLGFRPRDDQAASLGYEVRTWFEILSALGAYPATGPDASVNDNPDYLSRTTPYLACCFPNGTVTIARHFHDYEEGWPGGFGRDREKDVEYMKEHPLPDNRLNLEDFWVDGHQVNYQGGGSMAFRLDEQGNLLGFAGSGCTEIAVDGNSWKFSDEPAAQFCFAPIPEERRVPGGAVMIGLAYGGGKRRIPITAVEGEIELVTQGPTPGSRGEAIEFTRDGDTIEFELTPHIKGRWFYVVPKAQ